MRYIYVDTGCFDGDTVEQFRNWKHLAYSPDIPWHIYAFDPNPGFEAIWRKKSDERTVFECRAAWIEDGAIDYTLRPKEAPLGSTIMKEKRDWGMGEIFRVPCFDFAKWLEQFREDHVIVKMDIEGAELPVLTHLIKQGADEIIDKLFVEWHDGKMPKYKSNKDWIQKNLKCKWYNWR